jgi:predicted DNA-binding mobile mystery protein A
LKTRLNLTRLAELDRQFCEFAKLRLHATPRCGWAKTVRLALGMSSKALGDRLGMTAQGVRKLEQAEADASITLRTLMRLADGMDCEVHYVLLPRTSLLEQVVKRAHEVAGGLHEVSPRTRQLSTEPETLEMLGTLFAQASRRGFW